MNLPTEDAALLQAMALGDEGAFERLVRAWTPAHFAFAFRILRRREWAEEVVQDSFHKLWRNAAAFDPRLGKASSWMFSVLHRSCLDRLRRERVRGSAVTVTAEALPETAAAEALDPLLARRLELARARLSAEQSRVLDLSYFEGYSHEEIAAKLGWPVGTVKTRLRLAMARLRDAWGEAPREEPAS